MLSDDFFVLGATLSNGTFFWKQLQNKENGQYEISNSKMNAIGQTDLLCSSFSQTMRYFASGDSTGNLHLFSCDIAGLEARRIERQIKVREKFKKARQKMLNEKKWK